MIDFRGAYFQPMMGPVMWRGAPVIASSMNKSSSYPFLQSAIKRTRVSSQQWSLYLRIRSLFSQVVVRRRIVVSSWSSFPNTNVTSNLDDPG